VLGSANGPSSLAAYMSMAVELLEGRIDAVAANRVCWGSHSPLATAVSHFLELKTKLDVLGSRCSMDLTEHGADSIWIQVRAASDSLASHVTSSSAHNPPFV
jgi:hypothetical protein